MAAANVDAVVTWAPISVRYLTGYWCWIAPLLKAYMVGSERGEAPAMRNIALLPREGSPTLLVESFWALDAVGTGVTDIRLVGDADFALENDQLAVAGELERAVDLIARRNRTMSPFEALAAVLRELNLDGSRLAVELAAMPAAEVEELRALLPRAELLDCTSFLRVVRAVKTDEEIEWLRRAAEISESAAMPALETAREGMSTAEIALRFRESVAAAGGDFDHFAFGPSGVGLVTETAVELRRGDTLYADFGLVHDGWFADSGTSLSVGPPAHAAARDHAAVRDCVAAGAAVLRPGRRGSFVQAAMQETLRELGVTESFPHGHGLGLEVRDYPLIMPDRGLLIKDECIELPYDLELEPGMIVNLEAPLFTLGLRSVHCEQTFVITDDGCRPLVTQDRDSPVSAADSTGAR
jgi:Xaa-Pro dipeptidase